MAGAFAELLLEAFESAGLERQLCHFDEAEGSLLTVVWLGGGRSQMNFQVVFLSFPLVFDFFLVLIG